MLMMLLILNLNIDFFIHLRMLKELSQNGFKFVFLISEK